MATTDVHDDNQYLAKRTLKRGTAGWLLLAGLGVSYVISGDYSGWNFGLAEGGFGGLLIAGVVIAGMYLAMVLGMAEMSSALPAAGGGYTFARRAFGPWGGFATGTAILIEYAIAPAAIATFIGAYVESLGLFGITDGWWVYLAVYVLFIGIHLSRRRRSAQGHVRHHRHRAGRSVDLRALGDRQLRRRQSHRHRTHRRRRRVVVPAVRRT